ncbi:MAG: hypothetical protein LBJ64_12260 [Deltaproteobacteria bacterium]|nr:hypothetical protein [Deltaproteobacteria bacterium]
MSRQNAISAKGLEIRRLLKLSRSSVDYMLEGGIDAMSIPVPPPDVGVIMTIPLWSIFESNPEPEPEPAS